jgi:hypothetical protein
LDAEAGVKPRSPKGCAAAHGLDACIRVQHPFMPAGDTSHPNQINPIKNPLDSEHGIYRESARPTAKTALLTHAGHWAWRDPILVQSIFLARRLFVKC